MFAILGSGFGLYGYLPALARECRQRIVLPERYRARFGERLELAQFAKDIQWEQNETAALDHARGVVLALRPVNQMEWLSHCLGRSNIECLLLEKPLAQSPAAAAELLDDLNRSRKTFRIGYLFRHTAWGRNVLDDLGSKRTNGLMSIRWRFMAHHFRHELQNWKRFHAAGGGVIRFYGIQVIALLAEAGYRDVLLSRSFGASLDEVERWTAAFSGPGLPECNVVLDTRAEASEFRVEQLTDDSGRAGAVYSNLVDPFDYIDKIDQPTELDRRVPLLGRVCRSIWEKGESGYEWYDETIRLWRSVEERTQFEEARH